MLSGNQAIALGALVAGCRRYAGYPITPATDIMEFLADELPSVGGAVVQAEDEIAAIGMVLGASFAGQKAMTATSGPGISLMTEMLGLASMAEIPAVVIDCQRAGPSTGMPTRHEQGDLNLAVFGAHGEVQRVVLAPASVVDCFRVTLDAFNLAEEFQLPVIVLQDTVLAVRTESIPRPDTRGARIVNRRTFAYQPGDGGNGHGYDAASGPERYLRYEITTDGVSPMAIPGTPGGAYVATGLEHTQAANTSSEARNHAPMTEKRFKKLELALAEGAAGARVRRPVGRDRLPDLGQHATARCARRSTDWPQRASVPTPWRRGMLWPLPTPQIDAFLAEQAHGHRARSQLHGPVRPAAQDPLPGRGIHAASTSTVASRSPFRRSSRPSSQGAPVHAERRSTSVEEATVHADQTIGTPEHTLDDYKSGTKPTWCPGCGDFGVLNAVYNALRAKGYAPEDVVLVSGIGCSSRLPFFSSTYGFHTVHGRTMPIATGIKVANPKLKVLALGGDGDAFAIGGGHFMHAARRNLDICYVIMDNAIYGLTKGQTSPTSMVGFVTKTTPKGHARPAGEPAPAGARQWRHVCRPRLLGQAQGAGRPDRAGHRPPRLRGHRRVQPVPDLQQGQHVQVLPRRGAGAAQGPRPDELVQGWARAASTDPLYLGVLYRSEAEASFEEHIQAAMTGTEDDAPAVVEAILKRYS